MENVKTEILKILQKLEICNTHNVQEPLISPWTHPLERHRVITSINPKKVIKATN